MREYHNEFIEGCRTTIFPWIDGKTIYCNIECMMSGQSIEKPPVWEKTVYITDNEKGRDAVENRIHTLVRAIAENINTDLPDGYKVVVTVE